MDLDIEMADTGEAGDGFAGAFDPPHASEQAHAQPATNGGNGTGASTAPDADLQAIVANKIHIRGVDTLTTDEIRSYVTEHHGSPASRVEWIDDTSANLLFATDASARDAIIALSALPLNDPEHLPPLELLPAKPFAAKPEATLSVRYTVVGDRKQAGAASRSRFYLLHPEYDPEERRRRDRERYRDEDRNSGSRGRYGGRRRRDEDDEVEKFDETFYDEPTSSLASRVGRRGEVSAREDDRSDDYERQRDSRDNRDKELFPGGGGGNREKELFPSLRGRSASPRRRDRSLSPGRRRDGSSRSYRRSEDHSEASSRNRALGQALKDRITGSRGSSKELFPAKKIAGFNDKNRLDQLESVFGSARLETEDQVHPDDITPESLSRRDRGIIIHGLANGNGPSEFNIKGSGARTGNNGSGGKSATELFPEKLGSTDRNQGKELFSGRTQKRQKAGDLFH